MHCISRILDAKDNLLMAYVERRIWLSQKKEGTVQSNETALGKP